MKLSILCRSLSVLWEDLDLSRLLGDVIPFSTGVNGGLSDGFIARDGSILICFADHVDVARAAARLFPDMFSELKYNMLPDFLIETGFVRYIIPINRTLNVHFDKNLSSEQISRIREILIVFSCDSVCIESNLNDLINNKLEKTLLDDL